MKKYNPTTISAEDAAYLTSLCEVDHIVENGKIIGWQAVTRCDSSRIGKAVGRGETLLEAVINCHEDKRKQDEIPVLATVEPLSDRFVVRLPDGSLWRNGETYATINEAHTDFLVRERGYMLTSDGKLCWFG